MLVMEMNGSTKIKNAIDLLTHKQETIEIILVEGFDKTHEALKQVASEIRLTRESGFIPAPIVEKLVDHNNATNQKNNDKFFKLVIILLAVIIGIKSFVPHLFGN